MQSLSGSAISRDCWDLKETNKVCGVGQRLSSDPKLLWLQLAASALIRFPAWELPYAIGVALKSKKTKQNKKPKYIYIYRERERINIYPPKLE